MRYPGGVAVPDRLHQGLLRYLIRAERILSQPARYDLRTPMNDPRAETARRGDTDNQPGK